MNPITVDDKLSAQHICNYFNFFGLYYSLELKDNKFIITPEVSEQSSKVISITEIDYDDYVYDLETENHHFHAGVGSLIVHNTDSVYVKFHTLENKLENSQDKIKASVKVAYECAQMISNTFPKPMEIILEKVFYPFFISSKKRYVGDVYEPENPADPNTIPKEPKRVAMGLVLKRRDNCKIVKIVYGTMIDILMKERNKDKTIKFIKAYLDQMLLGKIPLEDFIISKSLKKDYAKPESQAHVVLANKIKERTPGLEPKSNDRVPYVFIHLPVGKKSKLQADKVEDPKWFKNHSSLKLDYGYYIEKQLKKPCVNVLKFIISEKDANKLFDDYINQDKKKFLATGEMFGGQTRLTDFSGFKPKIEDLD